MNEKVKDVNRKTLKITNPDYIILAEIKLERQRRGMKGVTLTGIFHEMVQEFASNEVAKDTK